MNATAPHVAALSAADAHAGGATVLRGVGLATPLGLGAWATMRGLLTGATLADRLAALPEDVDAIDRVRVVGSSGLPAWGGHDPRGADPAVELAERVAREAAMDAGAGGAGKATGSDKGCDQGAEMSGLACFLGTSKGAVTALDRAAGAVRRGQCGESMGVAPALAAALGAVPCLSAELSRRTGLAVHRHVVGACASSLQALGLARDWLIGQPVGTRAMVVTAESALLAVFIASYRRLGVLAGDGGDGYVERPLDRRRDGFVLAELAAAVVLERVEAVRPGEVALLSCGQVSEAYDLIRPAPEMPALSRLARELLAGGPCDVVHPHAPGTADHDPTELSAIARALSLAGDANETSHVNDVDERGGAKGPRPWLYANKGALGHGLGAAGLVSLVVAAMSLRCGRLPPMPWLAKPIEQTRAYRLAPAGTAIDPHGTHAVFAAGFGGHTAGAVIRRQA